MKIPTIIFKVLNEYFRYLAGAVVVMALLAGYILLIEPKVAEVRSAQLATRQADIEQLKLDQAYLEELKISNAKFAQVFTTERLKSIDNFLPSDPDFPGLLLTMKNLIAHSGLTMDSFSVTQGGQTSVTKGAATPTTGTAAQSATVGGVSVTTQDVAVTISGGRTYEVFKNLLTNIESSRRLFDVVSLSFASASLGASGATEAVTSAIWTMVIRTYYLPTSTK